MAPESSNVVLAALLGAILGALWGRAIAYAIVYWQDRHEEKKEGGSKK